VPEIRAGELDTAAKRGNERAVLDEHSRHGEADQREPRERDEVDPGEDDDARGGERQEGNRADEERAARSVPPSGRDDRRPEIAEAQGERPDDEPVDEARSSVDERGSDGERGCGDRDQDPAPERAAVEANRVRDQLSDGAVGRRDLLVCDRHARHRIPCEDGPMAYAVFPAGDQEFGTPSGGDLSRSIFRLSDSLRQTRANIWRYPPGARGRRHAEHVQEEVFVVLEGTATLYLGDPAEAVELPRGSVAVVEPGTAVQVANLAEEDMTVFIVGAPPEQGGADYLPDAG
jgi:quercetin dioxygenase-like cupin family protein